MVKLAQVKVERASLGVGRGVVDAVRERTGVVIGNRNGPVLGSSKITAGTGQFDGVIRQDKK